MRDWIDKIAKEMRNKGPGMPTKDKYPVRPKSWMEGQMVMERAFSSEKGRPPHPELKKKLLRTFLPTLHPELKKKMLRTFLPSTLIGAGIGTGVGVGLGAGLARAVNIPLSKKELMQFGIAFAPAGVLLGGGVGLLKIYKKWLKERGIKQRWGGLARPHLTEEAAKKYLNKADKESPYALSAATSPLWPLGALVAPKGHRAGFVGHQLLGGLAGSLPGAALGTGLHSALKTPPWVTEALMGIGGLAGATYLGGKRLEKAYKKKAKTKTAGGSFKGKDLLEKISAADKAGRSMAKTAIVGPLMDVANLGIPSTRRKKVKAAAAVDEYPVTEEAAKKYMDKKAKDMPHFTEQDRPKKVKEIYRALKREHPDMPAEMKARIAARQGKRGKQEQGPPYKAPIARWKEKSASVGSFRKQLFEALNKG